MADITNLARNLQLSAVLKISPGVRLANSEEEVQEIKHELEIVEERLDNLVEFSNHYEFPSCGERGRLYIAADEGDAIYIWDGDKYVPLTGLNVLQKQIAVINGGGCLDGE